MPVYEDFVVNAFDESKLVQIQVGSLSKRYNWENAKAILNGLEIMKMNNSARSLDGPYPVDYNNPMGSKGKNGKIGPIIVSVVGALAALGLLAAGYSYFFYLPRSKSKHSPPAWLPLRSRGNGSYVSSAPFSLGQCFTIVEIEEATNNFDENLILGVGGFGKVYNGELEDGTKVAVKRGNPTSVQGLAEFQTKIEILSELQHRHLVSLIGYCEECCETILV